MGNVNEERTIGKTAATGLVRGYQLCISPLLPACCRFYPTCSAYAIEAIQRFGALRGCYLALTRLVRCHPLCEGGVDLVPEEFRWLPKRQPLDELVESN